MSRAPRWTPEDLARYERKNPEHRKHFYADGKRIPAPIIVTTETQVLWIPGVMPGRNAEIEAAKSHWSKYATPKKQWNANIGVYIERAGIKPVRRARFIVQHIEQNRRRDPDNVYSASKLWMDSLVAHGILADDSQRYVAGIDFRDIIVDPDNPGTRIEIVPVNESPKEAP